MVLRNDVWKVLSFQDPSASQAGQLKEAEQFCEDSVRALYASRWAIQRGRPWVCNDECQWGEGRKTSKKPLKKPYQRFISGKKIG